VSLLNKARRLSESQTARNGEIRSPLPSDDIEGLDLRSQIAILLTRVSLWEPDGTTDITFQHSGRILQLSLTAMLIEAAHWAHSDIEARGRGCDKAYRLPQEGPCLDVKLKAVVDQGVTLLNKLPPVESRIATTMCWSIVVLGSYAIIPAHRTTIREYFLTMEATFGFDNMKRSRLTLEYIWAHIANFEQDRPLPVADAMRATGGMFILG
jgi:hypothetical protein